jgi:hypothetical protein
MRIALAVALVCGLAVPARGQSLNNLIPKSEVPAVVMTAADKTSPGAKWLIAKKWVEDGKPYYGLLGRDARDRLVQFMAGANGEVGDLRVTIPFAEVPAVVRNALKAQAPAFKADKAQEVGQKAGTVLYYRFEGEAAGGKKSVLIASPDGKRVLPGH